VINIEKKGLDEKVMKSYELFMFRKFKMKNMESRRSSISLKGNKVSFIKFIFGESLIGQTIKVNLGP